jgi:hypothetical protein
MPILGVLQDLITSFLNCKKQGTLNLEILLLKTQMLKFGKNSAGKERLMLTITGSIIVLVVAWITGTLFMPKRDSGNEMNDKAGIWINKSDSGFTRIEIKESGYFYYDQVLHKGKSKFYKGVITADGPLFDHRLLLIPFNADTLLNDTILELDGHHFKLKSIKDNSVMVFTK